MTKSSTFLAICLLSGAAFAEKEIVEPNPALAPEEVVSIQLEALQHNDEPSEDAGIERTWAFAHPDNKRVTGPLDRFKAMIKSPGYRMLLDHRAHRISRVAVSGDKARFTVTVTPASGPVVFYHWRLRKVETGPNQGAWMTIAVSPPLEKGNTI